MASLVNVLLGYVWSCYQSHERQKVEIVILRHQLSIVQGRNPKSTNWTERPSMFGRNHLGNSRDRGVAGIDIALPIEGHEVGLHKLT